MSAVMSKVTKFRIASAEFAELDEQLVAARGKVTELERKQRAASMRRNEAERELLEEAKR